MAATSDPVPAYVRRIERRLDDLFGGKIDVSDYRGSTDEVRRCFLQRALAAYTLVCLQVADPPEAIAAITDGGNDGGIDAIHVDDTFPAVFLVQSKWASDGKKTIDEAAALKFMSGIGRILHEEWDGLNDSIQAKRAKLEAAVADSRVCFYAVGACPSEVFMAEHAQRVVDTSLRDFNGPVEPPMVHFERFDVKRLYRSLLQTGASDIDLQITLYEWGVVTDPYLAYYGQVEVGDILDWKSHGSSLFERNLRNFQGQRTEVFASVSQTLAQEPHHFWYFNNGATMLCNSLKKTVKFGDKREKGEFDCRGVNVVNGAQTIGSIWQSERHGETLDPKTRMPLRIISLQDCPVGFDTSLTRAANTQNRISNRDFAALDPNQHRLAAEMHLEGWRYVYRSGDGSAPGPACCDIAEAAAALACARSMELAVQAKRELGRLWSDITREPYTLLFNSDLTADKLKRAILVLRAVEGALAVKANFKDAYRGSLIAAHGNRFVLYRVFADPEMVKVDAAPSDIQAAQKQAATIAIRELRDIADYVRDHFPNGYPQVIFKNIEKCREIDSQVPRGPRADPEPGHLF